MQYSMARIDGEDLNRRPANCGEAAQNRTVPRKMIGPGVLSGMEQSRDFTILRINARDVRLFVIIAVKTDQGQIAQDCGP